MIRNERRCCLYRPLFTGRRKRWHKAIPSQSIRGNHNPKVYSRFLPHEEPSMSHKERKEYVLPCGYTLAQSWAALHKSWRGFKIAKSRGDTARMTYYASFILKVQSEMGIGISNFSPDLDLEETVLEDPDRIASQKCSERSLDYENIFNDAKNQIFHDSSTIKHPMETLFSKVSRNYCSHKITAKSARRESYTSHNSVYERTKRVTTAPYNADRGGPDSSKIVQPNGGTSTAGSKGENIARRRITQRQFKTPELKVRTSLGYNPIKLNKTRRHSIPNEGSSIDEVVASSRTRKLGRFCAYPVDENKEKEIDKCQSEKDLLEFDPIRCNASMNDISSVGENEEAELKERKRRSCNYILNQGAKEDEEENKRKSCTYYLK